MRKDLAPDNGASCARCRYSLKGLPDHHICPECGLAFDRSSRLYYPHCRRDVSMTWVFIVSTVLLYGIIFFSGFPFIWKWNFANVAVLVCVGLGMFEVLHLWRRPQRTIVLTPKHLAIVGPKGHELVMAKSNVLSAKWSRTHGEIIIFLKDNRTMALPGRTFLGSHSKAKTFASVLSNTLGCASGRSLPV